MIDLPTPETDAVAEKNIYGVACKVDVDFARKLERERDEALQNLRILAGLVAYGLGQSGEEWSLEAMRQATAAIQKAKALEGEK